MYSTATHLVEQNCVVLSMQSSYSIQNDFQALVQCHFSCNTTCITAQHTAEWPDNCAKCVQSQFSTLYLFLTEFYDFPWAPPCHLIF